MKWSLPQFLGMISLKYKTSIKMSLCLVKDKYEMLTNLLPSSVYLFMYHFVLNQYVVIFIFNYV